MVGELADVDPLSPRFTGLPHLVGGFPVGLRRGMLGPGQCHERVIALFETGARTGFPALQSDPQVGGQPQRGVGIRIGVGPRDRLAIGLGRVLPLGGSATVVEGGLAVHHQFDRAAHASHGPQQDVLGIPVHRGTAVRARPGFGVMPGSHHQRIAHDEPAGMGLPGRFHDQTARQVAARRRNRYPVRSESEVPGTAVQDRSEHAGGVRARHAHPLHRAGRGDQAGVLAVREECIVGDRGKWASLLSGSRVRQGFDVLTRGLGLQNHPAIMAGGARAVHRSAQNHLSCLFRHKVVAWLGS